MSLTRSAIPPSSACRHADKTEPVWTCNRASDQPADHRQHKQPWQHQSTTIASANSMTISCRSRMSMARLAPVSLFILSQVASMSLQYRHLFVLTALRHLARAASHTWVVTVNAFLQDGGP
jgi:hypothetical protein